MNPLSSSLYSEKVQVVGVLSIQFNDCYILATVVHPPSAMVWGVCPLLAQLDASSYQPERRERPRGPRYVEGQA